MRSAYAMDVALPADLADLFGDLATAPVPVRSTIATLIADGVAVTTTAITFLQGPPAAAYWVGVVRPWLRRRRADGVGRLLIEGPGGRLVLELTADTDLAEVATVIHRALFAVPRPRPAVDDDDIAV
jgi:hypothetical protein